MSSAPRPAGSPQLQPHHHPQTPLPPQLAPATSPLNTTNPVSSLPLPPSPATKLLLLQLSLVCENAAQTSRRASEAGGLLRPEDVASLRESLTAAGFFFGQLHASTSAASTVGSRSTSPAPPFMSAHGGGINNNSSTFGPSPVSTAFSPSSISSSSSLSSIPRYHSPALSCPSPSSSSSPMSSPRPSTPLPPAASSTTSSASCFVGYGLHHSYNNNNANSNNPVSAAITSGLLEAAAHPPPTLTQAGSEARGLPLGMSFHAPRVCVDCGRESSIQWRSGPMGSSTLCNACGMRYMRKRKKEEKRRALLASAQGLPQGSGGVGKKRSRKRAKLQQSQPQAAGEKNQARSSSSSSEGEEEASASGTSHRASVNFLLN